MSADIDWFRLHGDFFRGSTCLVTGGLGFIGGHLTQALHELGATVHILDNATGGNASPLVEASLREGDVLDPADCAMAADQCHYAFHLAAKVSVPASVEDPVAYHAADATGTVNVLDACRRTGVRRVVYSASSSAYGDQPTLPKTEDMPPLPMSPYAAAKLAGEGYVRAYAACYEMDAVSLRYFNIFGPRQNANSAYAGVVAAFCRNLLAGRRTTIYGDGSATRDFTHVANAVHANLLAARHDKPLRGDIINVGTGRRTSVLELAQTLTAAAKLSGLVPEHKPPRQGDVAHSQASVEKAETLLGYEPVVELADGLQETFDWYRASAGASA